MNNMIKQFLIRSNEWLISSAIVIIILIYVLFFRGEPFSNFDPYYIHYYNGILLSLGNNLGNIDNPGLWPAVEVAFVIKLGFLFSSSSSIISFAVDNSELLIDIVCFINLGLFAIVLIFYSNQISNKLRRLAPFIVLTSFIGLTSFVHIAELSPNPFLIIATLLMTLPIILKNEGRSIEILSVIFLLLGILSKYTFIFHGLGLLYLVGQKRFLINLVYFICAFCVFHIVFIGDLADTGHWIWGILTHSGSYGAGEARFLDVSIWFRNVGLLILRNPFLFFVEVILAFYGIKNFKRHKSLVVLILADILLIFFGARNNPSSHYLLPIYFTLPLKIYYVHVKIMELYNNYESKIKYVLSVLILTGGVYIYSKKENYKSQQTLAPWVIVYLNNCDHCEKISKKEATVELAHEVGRMMVGWDLLFESSDD
jgi:hypothetical protein